MTGTREPARCPESQCEIDRLVHIRAEMASPSALAADASASTDSRPNPLRRQPLGSRTQRRSTIVHRSDQTETDNRARLLDQERKALLISPILIEPAISLDAVLQPLDVDAFHGGGSRRGNATAALQEITILGIDPNQHDHMQKISRATSLTLGRLEHDPLRANVGSATRTLAEVRIPEPQALIGRWRGALSSGSKAMFGGVPGPLRPRHTCGEEFSSSGSETDVAVDLGSAEDNVARAYQAEPAGDSIGGASDRTVESALNHQPRCHAERGRARRPPPSVAPVECSVPARRTAHL